VLAVAGGEIVEWANLSGSAQTLTAANDAFVSPAIAPGGRYQWAPTGSGVYPYTAGGAAGLEGAIVVSPNGAADFFDGRTVGEAYRDSCGACHGADRQGAIGPALVPESLTASDSFYIDTIRNGRPGTPMPNWKYTFSDAEIWMMLGFL
ncbi:MAG TPA: c-type cytochrome, partial [Promineifilum sp.]|nr:c-type cytochrome [Promineifilum sp.]